MNFYKNIAVVCCLIIGACSSLPQMAKEGDVDAVQGVVDSNVNLEEITEQNTTVLYEAVDAGHTEVVEVLLKAGANPDAVDTDDNWTPLIAAAHSGHSAIAKRLIGYKANLNAKNKAGENALMYAAKRGSVSIVGSLIQAGAELNAKNTQGMTALMIALGPYGSDKIALTFIKAGADTNTVNHTGWTPLAMASRHGHEGTVKTLLKKKANKNKVNQQSWTPLMLTAAKGAGHTNIAKQLLNKKVKKNVTNENKNTALSIAVYNGHFDLAKLLVAKGAALNVVNSDGDSALSIAVKNGRSSFVKLLLNKGARLNKANRYGDTPLMLASRNGSLTNVKLLVGKGAKLKSVDKAGDTALSIASQKGNHSVIGYLVSKGASLNTKNRYGQNVHAVANNQSTARYIAGLALDLKKSKYKKNQKCKLKNDSWYYLSSNCSNGLANGKGRSINLDTDAVYSGQFKNGYMSIGELTVAGQHIFTGPYTRALKPNGEGICFYQGDPEKCEFYHGKRIDTVYKQRLEMEKQERLLAQLRKEALAEQERQKAIAAEQKRQKERRIAAQRERQEQQSSGFDMWKAGAMLAGAAVGRIDKLDTASQARILTGIVQDSQEGVQGVSHTQQAADESVRQAKIDRAERKLRRQRAEALRTSQNNALQAPVYAPVTNSSNGGTGSGQLTLTKYDDSHERRLVRIKECKQPLEDQRDDNLKDLKQRKANYKTERKEINIRYERERKALVKRFTNKSGYAEGLCEDVGRCKITEKEKAFNNWGRNKDAANKDLNDRMTRDSEENYKAQKDLGNEIRACSDIS